MATSDESIIFQSKKEIEEQFTSLFQSSSQQPQSSSQQPQSSSQQTQSSLQQPSHILQYKISELSPRLVDAPSIKCLVPDGSFILWPNTATKAYFQNMSRNPKQVTFEAVFKSIVIMKKLPISSPIIKIDGLQLDKSVNKEWKQGKPSLNLQLSCLSGVIDDWKKVDVIHADEVYEVDTVDALKANPASVYSYTYKFESQKILLQPMELIDFSCTFDISTNSTDGYCSLNAVVEFEWSLDDKE